MTERTHYSIREFCEALGVGRTTVWRLIKTGQIEPLRLRGRVLIPVATRVLSGNMWQHSETDGNKPRRKRPLKSERNAHFGTNRNF